MYFSNHALKDKYHMDRGRCKSSVIKLSQPEETSSIQTGTTETTANSATGIQGYKDCHNNPTKIFKIKSIIQIQQLVLPHTKAFILFKILWK